MLPRIRLARRKTDPIKLGNGADIAFLLVVLSAYFTIFSSLVEITIPQLIVMIVLGVAYLMLGIYGFSLLSRYEQLFLDLTYFLLQITIGSLILYFGSQQGENNSLIALLFLPLIVQCVLALPQLWMLFVNVLILIAYTSVIIIVMGDGNPLISHFSIFFTAQIFIVFFTQMAVNESRSRGEVERLVTELAEANDHLRSYALKVEELAVTQERNRMAREIHDGLGHYLTSIHIQLQAASALLSSEGSRDKVKDGIEKAQNLAKKALADVRQSVSTLRSPLIGHLPLSELIRDHLQQTVSGVISIHFELEGNEIDLPPNVSWTILRATQEAVNNSIKHAQCSQITIILSYIGDNRIELMIEDDGVGSMNTTGGYGLVGLRERIQLLNGDLKITTKENEGFKVEIGVPIK